MEERDRVGVNIVVAGGAALAGSALGVPGETVAAMVPVVVQELTARRTRNVTEVTDRACQLRAFDDAELRAWVEESDRHASYLLEALEAAWATLDFAKLRTLAHVLADGMADDARLDVNQLVIRTFRSLEAGHVRVLSTLADSRHVSGPASWPVKLRTEQLAEQLPNLAEGIDSLVATLDREGCIHMAGIDGNYDDGASWAVTAFGRRCLSFINDGGAA